MRFTLLRMAKQMLSLESAVREMRFPANYRPRLLVTCSDVPTSYIDTLRSKLGSGDDLPWSNLLINSFVADVT